MRAVIARVQAFGVIYSGLHESADELIQAAVQENVDVLGISIPLGGARHARAGGDHALREYGAPMEETIEFVRENAPER